MTERERRQQLAPRMCLLRRFWLGLPSSNCRPARLAVTGEKLVELAGFVSKAITNLLITIENGATRPDEPVFVDRMARNRARKAVLEADAKPRTPARPLKMRITER